MAAGSLDVIVKADRIVLYRSRRRSTPALWARCAQRASQADSFARRG
jgi:hypothetical protein